ncbi:helix-turn-helix domain-containing protein [Chitinophaga defluvii]|uniref:AraC family transcriptional regulator n=1 Tax=Chitinophaga defluvii TaxID=3163343 RepID=A0ABV2T8P6_9BACT
MNRDIPLLSFYDQDDQPLRFEKGLPARLQHYSVLGATQHYVNRNEGGHLLLHLLHSDVEEAWMIQYVISKYTRLKVSSQRTAPILYYVIKGELNCELDEVSDTIVAGQINAITPPFANSGLTFQKPGLYQVLCISVPPDRLRIYATAFPIVSGIISGGVSGTILRHNVGVYDRINELVEQLVLLGPNALPRSIDRSQLVNEIVIFILQSLSKAMQATQPAYSTDIEKVDWIKDFLAGHIHQPSPPRISQLAEIVGLTEKKLEQLFKTHCDNTVRGYFKQVQFDSMYRDIVQANRPLSSIAEAYGYRDYSTFSAAIKLRFGESPTKLRMGGRDGLGNFSKED